MATELLSRRGLSSSALKLLSRQLDEEGLLKVRESLQRRLSEVEGLLGEGLRDRTQVEIHERCGSVPCSRRASR